MELSIEQREILIRLCKERVIANGIAYVHRVASDHKSDIGISDFVDLQQASRIAHYLVQQDSQYEVLKDGEFSAVRLNPNYKLNESIIKTNESLVRLNDEILPKNFDDQRKFGNKTLWLTLVSVSFVGLTLLKEYRDKTESKVQELSHKSDSLRKELKKIQSSLESLNSSIRQIATDTFVVKKHP